MYKSILGLDTMSDENVGVLKSSSFAAFDLQEWEKNLVVLRMTGTPQNASDVDMFFADFFAVLLTSASLSADASDSTIAEFVESAAYQQNHYPKINLLVYVSISIEAVRFVPRIIQWLSSESTRKRLQPFLRATAIITPSSFVRNVVSYFCKNTRQTSHRKVFKNADEAMLWFETLNSSVENPCVASSNTGTPTESTQSLDVLATTFDCAENDSGPTQNQATVSL